MENNRIPFDIEKWESGEYEAVYNIGTKPLEILISKKAKDSTVLSVYPNGTLLRHSENGVFDTYNDAESIYNLFLTPKKKKGWVIVFLNTNNGNLGAVTATCKIELNNIENNINNCGYKIISVIDIEY